MYRNVQRRQGELQSKLLSGRHRRTLEFPGLLRVGMKRMGMTIGLCTTPTRRWNMRVRMVVEVRKSFLVIVNESQKKFTR